MVGASGCTEEPDIRDELRFFWTVSAWESEFVVGEFVIAEFFSNARISFTNFLFSSRNSFSSFFSSCSSLFFCPNSLCKSEYILCNKSSFLLNTVFSSVFELFLAYNCYHLTSIPHQLKAKLPIRLKNSPK